MTSKYYVILTAIGAAKLANATALGAQLEITHMAIGDGGGTVPIPNSTQTKLVNECYRAPLNSLTIDENNANQIIAEMVLSESVGGWYIRETGLYDAAGDLIAVANAPESYKPQLQEGSGRTQVVRMVLIVSSTSTVSLKIDPAVVLATRNHVEQLISEHEKSLKHPSASLDGRGFVQLNAAINSTSNDQAATPSAVKKAYDLAASKLASVPAASTAQAGITQLNDAVNSTSTTQAATANAVKKTYDFANTKVKSVNGKTGTDIALSAADVDSVSASQGGTFQKSITVRDEEGQGYGNQYDTLASYYTKFETSGTSEYHPAIKQLATVINKHSYVFSQGTLVDGDNLFWTLHVRGQSGGDSLFKWNKNGDFSAPRNIAAAESLWAGPTEFKSNGDINGSVFGGWLTDWARRSFISDVRLGAEVIGADNRIGHHPGGANVITGVLTQGDNRITHTWWRPLQKLIGGVWYNFSEA